MHLLLPAQESALLTTQGWCPSHEGGRRDWVAAAAVFAPDPAIALAVLQSPKPCGSLLQAGTWEMIYLGETQRGRPEAPQGQGDCPSLS